MFGLRNFSETDLEIFLIRLQLHMKPSFFLVRRLSGTFKPISLDMQE